MRVGQRVNYDRLILEVWTKGTVLPEDALLEAGMILRKHLNPFVMLQELGEEVVTPSRATIELSPAGDSAAEELLNKPVSILNLSVRASNCLDAARILTLRDLVTKTEGDLLRVRSFGKTSLHEVQRKLAELNFSLGMKIGETGAVTEQQPQGSTLTGDQPQMPTSADESATTSQPPAEQAEGSSANPGSGPVEVFTMPE
jgi:DNA-directed RNA polymerase subunit alpha